MRSSHLIRNTILAIVILTAFTGGLYWNNQNLKHQRALRAVNDATANAKSDPTDAPRLTAQVLPITGTKIHVKFFADGVYLGPSVIAADRSQSLLSPSTSLNFATQLSTEGHKPITKCESPGKSSTTAFVATIFGKSVPVCEIHAKEGEAITYLVSQAMGPDGNIYVSLVMGSTGRDLKPFYGSLKQLFDSIRMNY